MGTKRFLIHIKRPRDFCLSLKKPSNLFRNSIKPDEYHQNGKNKIFQKISTKTIDVVEKFELFISFMIITFLLPKQKCLKPLLKTKAATFAAVFYF
jgi:hypothetical protein